MKKTKLKKVFTVAMSVVCATIVTFGAYAASGSKAAGEYGTLNASNVIGVNDYEKVVSLSVSTTSKIPKHYIIKYNVVYADTGVSITGDVSRDNVNILYNSPNRSYEDVEMHHWKNARTGKPDGFVNTNIKAYSTHEARGDYASYAIYLSESL